MKTTTATAHFGVGLAFILGATATFANPIGGTVVGGSGNGTIDGQGTALTTINQSVNRIVINWQDFSIAAGEVTRFVQPSSTAIALNRVTSGNASKIYGSLEGNGRVFVINPNGILVGPGGHIDTKGFVASTLDVADASFLSGGKLIFSGDSTAPINNQGSINALGGNVFLIAHTVDNSGSILAPQGTVGLAAGSQVQLVQSGNEHVSVLAGNSSAPAAVGVNNSGTIEGASAELKAAGGNIYALAINNGGVVRASGIVNENGHIYLRAAGGNIVNSGTLAANNADGSGGTVVLDGGHNATAPSTVVNSGTISARGDASGTQGGTVEVLGDGVSLTGTALVDVSGDAGGGTTLIGGDMHGANPAIQNSQQTEVADGAVIRADAVTRGDGGKIVVWSDGLTDFKGSLSAVGGANGGNGGNGEVSGHNLLRFGGSVDLSAPFGRTGQLLLDPAGDTVVATGDPGDGSSFVDVTTVNAATADFLLQAGGNIFINAPILNTHAGAGLNAQAGNDINVNSTITMKGTVSLSANDPFASTATGSGSVNVSAAIDTSSGSGGINLSVNGGSGTIQLGANLTTGGGGSGDITLDGQANATAAVIVDSGNAGVIFNSGVSTAGGTVQIKANTLTLNGAGNVGSSGTRVNTTITSLIDNKSGGSAFLNESGGLNLKGALAGSSLDLVTATGTTLNGALTAGPGDSVALSGPVTDAGGFLVTAGTLTLAGTGQVGTGGKPLLTTVDNLIFNKPGADSFVQETDGVNLHGSSVGNVTLAAGGDINIDAAYSAGGSGMLTANGGSGTLTLSGSGDVGSSGTSIDTTVAKIIDSKTSGNAFISQSSSLTLEGATPGNLTLGVGGNTITIDSSYSSGGGVLTANTLALTGVGNVGAGGAPINTAIANLTDNKTAGSAFISESSGLNLSGTMTGSSLNLAAAGTTTLNGALTAGAGDSITLSGAVTGGANLVTVGTLTLAGGGQVGSGINPLLTTVDTLIFNKTGSSATTGSFVKETDGVTLQGSSSGNVTLNTGGDITINSAFSAAGGNLMANSGNGTMTLTGAGDVGSTTTPINTTVATLIDDKSSGNAFISEANAITLEGATAGNLTLNALGNTITIDSSYSAAGGVLSANTLALTGAGDVGSSGAAINTTVGVLTDNKTSGTAFVSESDGLNLSGNMPGSSLNLADAGTTTLNGALTAGAGDSITLSGAVTGNANIVTVGTLTLAGNGAVGVTGTPLLTTVDTLIFNKSGGNAVVQETDGVTLHGSSAGSVTLNTGGDIAIDAAYSAAGGTLTANGGAGTLTLTGTGNIGSSGSRINTAVATLVDNKSGGTAFISEADGLNLHGTFSGSSLDLADIGTTVLDTALTTDAANSVALSGAVNGPGLLTAGTLTLGGGGDVGANGTPLNTAVNKLVLNKSSGNSFVSEVDGLILEGSSLGNVTVGTGGDINIDAAYSAAGGTLTANGGAGSLTLSGPGNVGSSTTPIDVTVANLIESKSGGNSFINESDDVTLSGSSPGDLTLATGGNILIDGSYSIGGGMLTANGGNGTLTLSGAGDVGTSGSPIDTTIANLTLAKTSGNVFVDEANDLSLQGTTPGNLDVTTHGAINQDNGVTGALVVGGTATFSAGKLNKITLNNTHNNFNIVDIASSKDVVLADMDDITVAANSSISGNLTVTAKKLNPPFPHLDPNNKLTFISLTDGTISVTALGTSLVDLLDAGSSSVPLPRLDIATFRGADISTDEAAKLLPPGSIGTLWLQLPFTSTEEHVYKIEDVSKWTTGRIAASGTTAGPQTPK